MRILERRACGITPRAWLERAPPDALVGVAARWRCSRSRRRCACCCARRCSRCATVAACAASSRTSTRADVERGAARAHRAAISSRVDLDASRARGSSSCPGCAASTVRRRVARPHRGDARGARARSRAGATTALREHHGERVRGRDATRRCRCSPGRAGTRARGGAPLPALRASSLAPLGAPLERVVAVAALRLAAAPRQRPDARARPRRATTPVDARLRALRRASIAADAGERIAQRRASSYVDLRYPNGFAAARRRNCEDGGAEACMRKETKNLIVGLDIGTSKVVGAGGRARARRHARGPRHGQPRVARA